MKVTSCKLSGMEVSPTTYNACTFQIIDKWDPDQHAKTCDTMFYLSDGTGAYVWDCDHWKFLDFTGVTQSDWTAKQDEAGYVKNKPFKTLGNGLSVDENGVLQVTVKSAVISVNGQTGEVKIDGTKIVVSADDSRSVAEAIKDSGGGKATSAEKLSTARDLKVDLTSKLAQSFDGSADATTIGVTGTLPLANGGTGRTDGLVKSLYLTRISSNTDLDTITTAGYYNYPSGDAGITNGPITNPVYFSLLVESITGATIIQTLKFASNKIYTRTRSGSPLVWSDWVENTNQNNSTNVPLTDGTINTNAKNAVLKYRILNDVIYISGSIDVVASDSNGESIKVGNIPEQYQPKKLINGVGKVHLNVGLFSKGFENAQVVVVGDENAAAKGAVMFSVQSSAKLTAGTWTFFGSYNLI